MEPPRAVSALRAGHHAAGPDRGEREQALAPRLRKTIDTIPRKVLNSLVEYDWPGNVRELENVIERAMILTPGSTLVLTEPLLPGGKHPSGASSPVRESTDRDRMIAALEDCGWKIKGAGNAAERLGMKPSTLRYRMKVTSIRRPEAVKRR